MNSPELLLTIINGSPNTNCWNSLFGAGLGAAFYILMKTQKYLVDRSFDPKYNNAYLMRFVTGIVAGFILSNILGFVLDPNAQGASAFAKMSPGVVALLGGFSAEAVEQILQRMVEVMLALVRGDASGQTKAEQAVAQAKKTAEQAKKDSALREKLTELQTVASDPVKFPQALEAIRSMLK
jgi:hypothetical protein